MDETTARPKGASSALALPRFLDTARAYVQAVNLPPEAAPAVVAAMQAAEGLRGTIAKQSKMDGKGRRALVGTPANYVITDLRLKELDEFVHSNGIPYHCLYITREGQIAIRASGWIAKGMASPRIFKGWDGEPLEIRPLENGNLLFRKAVAALFWTGERFPAEGLIDLHELQARRQRTEASPAIAGMIAETRAKSRAMRGVVGLPYDIAEDVEAPPPAPSRPAPPAPGDDAPPTTLREFLARCYRVLGLNRTQVYAILKVSDGAGITDFAGAWETVRAAHVAN